MNQKNNNLEQVLPPLAVEGGWRPTETPGGSTPVHSVPQGCLENGKTCSVEYKRYIIREAPPIPGKSVM